MTRATAASLILAAALATAHCRQSQPVTDTPPPAAAGASAEGSAAGSTSGSAAMTPVATVTEVMKAIVIPASNAVFKAAATPPADELGWMAAREQALAVAESSNLLLMAGRAPDTGDWTTLSVAQRDAALAAVKAIDAKDGDGLSAASDALYGTCDNCHQKYMPGK